MTVDKLKQFLLVAVIVFVGAVGAQFLAMGVDIFHSDLATWQVIVNAGITAVITYVVAWLVPLNKEFGLK